MNNKTKLLRIILLSLASVFFIVVLVSDIVNGVSVTKIIIDLVPYVFMPFLVIDISNKKTEEKPKEEEKDSSESKTYGFANPQVEEIFESESTKDARYKKLQALRLEGKISSREYQKAIERLEE